MKQQRWLILIVPFLLWLFSQIFLRQAEFFYIALALGALLIIVSLKFLTRLKPHKWLLFIIAPTLLFLSFSGLVAVLLNNIWIQSVLFLEFIFIFFYLRSVYYYFYFPVPLWRERLDYIIMASGFLSIYAFAAVLFYLPAFLSLSPFVMPLVMAVVMTLLFLQFNLFPRDNWQKNWYLIFIIVLILTELAWALSLWPLVFNLLAMFLAMAYYLGLIIIRLAGRNNLNYHTLRLPLLLSVFIFLILFLTARWL